MKKILLTLGQTVAVLLMFSPLAIIVNYEKLPLKLYIFLLIVSILYDIYMYEIIKVQTYIENKRKLFDKVVSEKALKSETEEEKMNWYKTICYNLFLDYFNKDKKNNN